MTPQHLRVFPKKNIILTNYTIGTWWLHLLAGLGHYVIWKGEVEHVLVTSKKLRTFGYTYAKRRLNNPPDIIYTLTQIVRLTTQTSSSLAQDLDPQDRD